ncbi:MAG: hypothetical protein HY900_07735 [Deltaproteobacteria bacterium]|nr:hypothetical protein [Deltaproteobacteria bacterium]
MRLPHVRAARLDPVLDLLTVDFDDGAASPDSIEDALAAAGYVVDRLPPR